jgi:hypothetical protein
MTFKRNSNSNLHGMIDQLVASRPVFRCWFRPLPASSIECGYRSVRTTNYLISGYLTHILLLCDQITNLTWTKVRPSAAAFQSISTSWDIDKGIEEPTFHRITRSRSTYGWQLWNICGMCFTHWNEHKEA